MSGLENVSQKLRLQYTSAYGPFMAGEYQPGDTIKGPGIEGEIIWSYRSPISQSLVYVIEGDSFPVEVPARDVRQSK